MPIITQLTRSFFAPEKRNFKKNIHPNRRYANIKKSIMFISFCSEWLWMLCEIIKKMFRYCITLPNRNRNITFLFSFFDLYLLFLFMRLVVCLCYIWFICVYFANFQSQIYLEFLFMCATFFYIVCWIFLSI